MFKALTNKVLELIIIEIGKDEIKNNIEKK